MLKAIQMISNAKKSGAAPVVDDVHPDRPEYRGFMIGKNPISFPADPAFAEI
jgi:7,8-dihydropterin-6-yl-methyl-4-(beta-D-ribofuranosyl)aminobenzene 5'-phosphate synthase